MLNFAEKHLFENVPEHNEIESSLLQNADREKLLGAIFLSMPTTINLILREKCLDEKDGLLEK